MLASESNRGKAVGTPAYMPPEQFHGQGDGPQADWYALGCLACEMLTGTMLFDGHSWSTMLAVKQCQQPSLRWPAIDVSDEMRLLIHGALQPSPAARTLDLERIARWADRQAVVEATQR